MKTIICQSFPAWDTPYVKSTLELIKRMARTHRVIFLDYPYTLKDVFSNEHVPTKAVFTLKPRTVTTEHGEIEIYNCLPQIPAVWTKSKVIFRFLMWINGWIQSLTIKRVLRAVKGEDVQLINAFNPVNGYFTNKYWKGLSQTYYAYDQLEATAWAGKWGKEYEKPFVSLVKRVVVSSSGLVQKFQQLHPNVFCVKNGVSLDHFSEVSLEKTSRKKLGYLGAFDDRVDLELVRRIAGAHEDYLIEILGTNKLTEEVFPNNVIFLGKKEPESLNGYVQEWDAALIPFVKNEFTQAIYPLKINEYLAAGKPVISTDFSDLSDFAGIVRVCENHEDFIKGIKKEIRYNNRLKISKRIEFASGNSWEARAEDFLLALAS